MVRVLQALCLTLFICAFIIFSTSLYFAFSFKKLPSKVNPNNQKISFFQENKKNYNFERVLAKFYQNEGKETTIEPAVSLPSSPEIKGIFWKKNGALVLLDFNGEKVWAKTGEEVKGWKIKKVFPSSAVLSFNGKEFKLTLFEKKEKDTLWKNDFSKISPENQGILVISREEFNRLVSDIGSLFTKIDLKPYLYRGKIEGLRVVYIAPGSIFEKAGLRKGDILLTFNGISVRTPEDAYKVFETLKTSPFVSVKIKRGDKIVTLKAEVK